MSDSNWDVIVIGGLFHEQQVAETYKVPFFGDIPFFGAVGGMGGDR